MAGRNRDDYCILCGDEPCEMHRPKKKATKPALPRNEPVRMPKLPANEPLSRPTRAGLGAVRKAPAKTVPPVKASKLPPMRVDPEEEEMKRAITVLAEAGLLDEDEMRKHRRMINLTDTRIRAIVWAQRKEVRERGSA